jgi:hypothetical protein
MDFDAEFDAESEYEIRELIGAPAFFENRNKNDVNRIF